MTKTLDTLRAEIDAVDAELVAALAKRSRLVAEVASAKAAGSAIFRPGREADVKTRLKRLAPNDQNKLIEPVWRPLLRASIASQKPDFRVAFPPEAETKATIFAADFLRLAPAETAAASLDMVRRGVADIAFVAASDLASIITSLGAATGLYIVAKEADCFLVAAGFPDPSEADITIFATKGDGGVEFLERDGYFETVPADMTESAVIGIFQTQPDLNSSNAVERSL